MFLSGSMHIWSTWTVCSQISSKTAHSQTTFDSG